MSVQALEDSEDEIEVPRRSSHRRIKWILDADSESESEEVNMEVSPKSCGD